MFWFFHIIITLFVKSIDNVPFVRKKRYMIYSILTLAHLVMAWFPRSRLIINNLVGAKQLTRMTWLIVHTTSLICSYQEKIYSILTLAHLVTAWSPWSRLIINNLVWAKQLPRLTRLIVYIKPLTCLSQENIDILSFIALLDQSKHVF